MARKPKKPYRPPVSPVAAAPTGDKSAAPAPMPEPRTTKRVREVKISAKEKAREAKRTLRVAYLKRTA